MSLEQIKNSGILELYVMGDLNNHEMEEVEKSIELYPVLKQEIYSIELAFESYARAHAVAPAPDVKPMLRAVADYTLRLENGEAPENPPSISLESKIEDYKSWLDRANLQEPEGYDSMFGHIIGSSEEKTTLIVWLKDGAPDETHTDEYEKFLIVEGTCNITIEEEVHSLKAGDVLMIPLFVNHRVEVTSSIPCKIILERAAA